MNDDTNGDDVTTKIDELERRIDARLLRYWEKMEEVAEMAELNGIAFGAVMSAVVAHKNDQHRHLDDAG